MQDSNGGSTPLVSVCIANFNGIDVIGPCIDSVLKQNSSYKIEILVHDDASTDLSCDFIKKNYPSVTLIESKANRGYSISNNILAEKVNGKYILFLNNDAVLFDDAIQHLIEYAESSENPCILGLPQFDKGTSELIDRGAIFDLFLNPVANKDTSRIKVGMTIGACMWIPKLIWLELGGFPPWFESLAEDMYLCIYALQRGYDVCILKSSGYFHEVGSSFGGGKIKNNRMITTYRRRRLSERNKSYVMVLSYPWPLLLIVLPIHLVELLSEGLILTILKFDSRIFREIYLNAIISIWKNKSLLLTKRLELQSRRIISVWKFLSYFTFYPYKLKMLIQHGLPTLK